MKYPNFRDASLGQLYDIAFRDEEAHPIYKGLARAELRRRDRIYWPQQQIKVRRRRSG
ncbi:hypothetical protein [Paenibacillus sp. D9]|uniref:hypothetical protein n=1 Tax=Paenibacillus sp. D9 TaxID=665792 RepID=UPI000ADC903A|nr:hypothetical protein [Paenibacillus sp. D9]